MSSDDDVCVTDDDAWEGWEAMNGCVINGFSVHVLNEADVARSSTLEPSDVGRHYILVNGCVQFVPDEED